MRRLADALGCRRRPLDGKASSGDAGILERLGCRRRQAKHTGEQPMLPPLHVNPLSRRHSVDGEDDAETFWANEYGRYKHCGLRPDPFAAGDRPAYSSAPLDIPLPPLKPAEAAALKRLQERTGDLPALGQRADPTTLLRYLRAAKGSASGAETMLRKAAKYRKEHDVARALTHWNLEAYEACLAPWWLSGGLMGHGLKGEPVALERIGRCSWPRLSASVPWDALQKIDIVHVLRCLGALEEDALRRGVPFCGCILVVDVSGFSWEHVQFRAAYQLSKLAASRSLLMPETVKHMLFVRTPKPFVKAWGMFKHLLDPGTIEKVQMATEKDSLALLRRYLSDDAIPAYLGGRKHVEGDPECRKLLAPGGFPPKAALDRLHALLGERPGDLTGCSTSFGSTTPGSKAFLPEAEDTDGPNDGLFCGLLPRRCACG